MANSVISLGQSATAFLLGPQFLIVSGIFTFNLFPDFWAYLLARLFLLLIVEIIGVLVINHLLPKSYKHTIKMIPWTFTMIGSLFRGVRNGILDLVIANRTVATDNAEDDGLGQVLASIAIWIGIICYMD